MSGGPGRGRPPVEKGYKQWRMAGVAGATGYPLEIS